MKTTFVSALLVSTLLVIAFAIVLPSNLQAATQKEIDPSPAGEEMVLMVKVFGLLPDGPHSDVLLPVINVSTSLLNPEETTVWQEIDVTGHNQRKKNASPEQLMVAWRKISDMVGRMLVKELSQTR